MRGGLGAYHGWIVGDAVAELRYINMVGAQLRCIYAGAFCGCRAIFERL
jgi:hypothetical protein